MELCSRSFIRMPLPSMGGSIRPSERTIVTGSDRNGGFATRVCVSATEGRLCTHGWRSRVIGQSAEQGLHGVDLLLLTGDDRRRHLLGVGIGALGEFLLGHCDRT